MVILEIGLTYYPVQGFQSLSIRDSVPVFSRLVAGDALHEFSGLYDLLPPFFKECQSCPPPPSPLKQSRKGGNPVSHLSPRVDEQVLSFPFSGPPLKALTYTKNIVKYPLLRIT